MIMHIAHMNIARLRAPPGDPLVAEFIDNIDRVHAIAERSPGFVWRFSDRSSTISEDVQFQAVLHDPMLAVSLTVWQSAEHLRFFVYNTLHGGFFRRRESWFEPMKGANYVIWPVDEGTRPTPADGLGRLAMLDANRPTDDAYDFSHLKTAG